MIYLDKLHFPENKPSGYPFIKALSKTSNVHFSAPVTILSGDNGCGKTTLAEIIAAKMDCYEIAPNGKSSVAADRADVFRIEKRFSPRTRFFFTSEDFVLYIKNLEAMQRSAEAELENIEKSNMGDYAKSQASLPHASGLHAIKNMYGRPLDECSHGEGYLNFFSSRLRDNGFFVLDEPEAALNYKNQFVLACKIHEYAQNRGCQFIIATHSPVISAIPNAEILVMSENGIEKISYDKLDNISFLKYFLERRKDIFD